MKEEEREKGERPPLAVPLGWFELETPAGIQACTSCRGASARVSVRRGGGKTTEREGGRGGQSERRRPVVCRQLPIRLLGLSLQ